MRKPDHMTFFLLHLIRLIIFFAIALLTMFIIETIIIVFEPDTKLSESILLICLSLLFWVDILVFRHFKGDLFTKKYENTTSQWVFQIMYALDYVLGSVLVVFGIFNLIKYLVN